MVTKGGILSSAEAEKKTMYEREYFLEKAEKYRKRFENHWHIRIDLIKKAVEDLKLDKPKDKTVIADLGCSCGTFAIEFGKLGYKTIGIDFNESFVGVAEELAKEFGSKATFVCDDITDLKKDYPKIDIAICYDIFEHLEDYELISFLMKLKKKLSKNGYIIFHTYPTEYDYLLYGKSYLKLPLIPFCWLNPKNFDKVFKIYSAIVDIAMIIFKGKNHKDYIENIEHCNPTTKKRITKILEKAGYKMLYVDQSNIYPMWKRTQKIFAKQPMSYRNLFGVVKKEN